MNRDIERLQGISTTARTNPDLLTSEDVTFVTKSLQSSNEKVVAQAYATVGQIGINRSELISHLVDRVFSALKDKNGDVREQALLALGTIGRSDITAVSNRLDKILQMHCDPQPKVRGAMLIACQSIVHASAVIFKPFIGLFERMLDDPDEDLVQKSAIKTLRTIGKYEPEIVERSLVLLRGKLRNPSQTIQAQAVDAIRIIETYLRRTPTV